MSDVSKLKRGEGVRFKKGKKVHAFDYVDYFDVFMVCDADFSFGHREEDVEPVTEGEPCNKCARKLRIEARAAEAALARFMEATNG